MPRLSKIGAAALAAFGWTSGSSVSASYLVVAGGGGGHANYSGGGGAGGLLTGTTTLNPTLSYTIVIGAGGIGEGGNGSNSTGFSFTAIGGGGGGYTTGGGAAGGSGGGAGNNGGAGGAGTSGQGNNGGAAGGAITTGGGGGAGAVGGTGNNSNQSGAGGAGLANPITGSTVGQLSGGTYYLAGGGGGGGTSSGGITGGAGGLGGGGAGATTQATAGTPGTANTGGGSGGSSAGAYTPSGNGGSGVVIISYPSPQKFGGGIVTTSGANTIHTFQTSGTLSPLSSLTASYLIVAGGGGGGSSAASVSSGSGGGAGGLLSGSGLTIDTNSIYVVTVGSGGAGGASGSNAGVNGSNSAFSMVSTAAVGGGFGTNNNGSSGGGGNGGNGGSGGGSYATAGTGTSGQGNNGGANASFGGGGGGASAVGAAGSGSAGGAGGAGTASSISGTSVTYAGGGGGSGPAIGAGGAGGGGSGGYGVGVLATNAGVSGTAGLGGGGGGSYGYSSYAGGNGGSGVVIISYASATQLMAGGTVTISGGNVIHTFTSSGYLAPLDFVGNSLRFRASNNNYLARTYGTPTNNKVWTWSAWVKRGSLSLADANHLFMGTPTNVTGNPTTYSRLVFETDNTLRLQSNGSAGELFTSSAVYRDPAAWYHIVLSMDASNTIVRCYVNGTEITYASRTNPTNSNTAINGAGNFHRMGFFRDAEPRPFDGYMTDINFIDGQALTPNSFGTFNSYGVWQPITYGGSYGTNGFYLPFTSNNSTYAGGFNGSTQYLSVAQNAAFNFGTGDFTVECWINATSWRSDANPIIALGAGAVGGGSPVYTGWSMRYDTTNGLGFYRFDGTETFITTNSFLNTNQWYHIAVSRASGTMRFFVDGVQVYSVASSLSYNNVNSNPLLIGGNWVIGGGVVTWVTGSISNMRVIAGTGLYTSNFTLPTTNLTAVSGTSLLTLQNATIVDNSTNTFIITNNGTVVTGLTYPFSAAKIFNDQSPQGNNWTPNNFSGASGSTLDYMTDVPTLTSTTAANYCTLNPLRSGASFINNANLSITGVNTGAVGFYGTMYSTDWYAEVTVSSQTGAGPAYIGIEIQNGSSYSYVSDGTKESIAGNQAYSGVTYTTGDVIGITYSSTGTLTFYKNNSSQGTAFSGLSGNATISFGSGSATARNYNFNFGQQPFVYTAPSGFLPLNTFNL